MCEGMWTIWPAAGISGSSLSAAASARSGVFDASTARIKRCSAPRCSGCVVRLHRQVDVGPKREADAPPAHRAIGIEPRCFAEGADRFRMIEREKQADALIEIALSLGIGRGDRMMMIAIAIEQRRTRPVRNA